MDEQIHQAKLTLHNLILTDWLTNDLFSPRWYGSVAFILFSYALVFWLLDKRRFLQLLLFGSLMTVMNLVYDIFGVNFILWTYTTRIFPVVPSVFLYDLTIVPLYYMLVYQYSPNWKSFIVWNAVMAGAISFGLHPLLTKLGMLKMHNWNYAYTFPFMFGFGLLGRAVVLRLMAVEEYRRRSFSAQSASNLIPQPAMKHLDNNDDPKDE